MTKSNDLKSLKNMLKKAGAEMKEVPVSKVVVASGGKPVKVKKAEAQSPAKYKVGCTVRLMDSNDEGTLVGVKDNVYEVELEEGFRLKLSEGQFVVINKSEDRQMLQRVGRIKKEPHERKSAGFGNIIEIDLHISSIPGSSKVAANQALPFQVEYFKRILRSNLRHKGMRIIFIHGDGDGKLRDTIRKELDEVFALYCTYSPAPSDKYGTGATTVTII